MSDEWWCGKCGAVLSDRDSICPNMCFAKDEREQARYVQSLKHKLAEVARDESQLAEQVGGHQLKYPHYFKPCPYSHIDVYRVLLIFGVTDPCIQHAAKKLLAAGSRGTKDAEQDVQEAIDTLRRWQEMRAEESGNE